MSSPPEVRIRRQSPHTRRRRRRAQQQSRCCGCLLAFVCLALAVVAVRVPLVKWRKARADRRQSAALAEAYFPVSIQTDAEKYYRYALVGISVSLTDAGGQPLSTSGPPQLLVRHNGEFVETVGGFDHLIPQYDPQRRRYICNWPVPWNCPPGLYTLEALYRIKDPQTWPWETQEDAARKRLDRHRKSEPAPVSGDAYCVVRKSFEVLGRKPPALPPGLCAATWEEMLPQEGFRMRKPDGSVGDWRAMFDWCEFMGADALWVRGAVTQVATMPLTMEEPFVPSNLALIPTVAAEAHRRGLKFGAWACAYATLPDNPSSNDRKPPYAFAKGVSRRTGQVTDTSFVSLLDQRRFDHLASFFREMQAQPDVDYIGLDYLRTEPGYELTDTFSRLMPLTLPANWWQLDQEARWKYMFRRTEPPRTDEDKAFYDSWNWYRAHLGAWTVANLIARSGAKKPVWVFSLSWQHGTQHGQDPLMLTDAGAGFIAPMLYQIDTRRFPYILRDWARYMKPGEANLVPGDQVDNIWHQHLGPEELYRRMMAAHKSFIPGSKPLGAFWHDISRAAVTGRLGPYSGLEWALAGGAAFSQVRESWHVYPLRAALTVPPSALVGLPLRLEVSVENLGNLPVRRIAIQPYSAPQLTFERSDVYQVPELRAGEKLTIPFAVTVTRKDPGRGNRFLAAFRVTWAATGQAKGVREDLPRVIIVMGQVQVGKPPAPVPTPRSSGRRPATSTRARR